MSNIKVTKEQIGAILSGAEINARTEFDKCTVVTVKLPNGFILTESSACVDPENYDMDLGIKICMEHITNRLWELEGYKLQNKCSECSEPVPDADGMDAQRESKILEDAVDTFGMEAQAVVAVEELSELQKALCKWLRYRTFGQGDYDQIITNLREEMADVNIMLGQLHFIFGDVTEEETEKLLRLEKMIEATIHDER